MFQMEVAAPGAASEQSFFGEGNQQRALTVKQARAGCACQVAPVGAEHTGKGTVHRNDDIFGSINQQRRFWQVVNPLNIRVGRRQGEGWAMTCWLLNLRVKAMVTRTATSNVNLQCQNCIKTRAISRKLVNTVTKSRKNEISSMRVCGNFLKLNKTVFQHNF